jgi:hypothetical protein
MLITNIYHITYFRFLPIIYTFLTIELKRSANTVQAPPHIIVKKKVLSRVRPILSLASIVYIIAIDTLIIVNSITSTTSSFTDIILIF